MVFTYPYAPQVYQPAPVPSMYMPPQYYQPTVPQPPKKHSNNKEKENEKEKERGPSEKSHEKNLPAGVSPTYPYVGYVPQGYAPQGYVPQGIAPQIPLPPNPNPVPPAQTTWRIKLYRPILTIPRPQPQPPVPVFNQGYPVTNQPYQIPDHQIHQMPLAPQLATPGLRPLGNGPEIPQAVSPPTGFPLQPILPVNTPQVPYPYPGNLAGQIPPRYPWQATQKIFQPNTCPGACPIYCAPACHPTCCKDRT